MDNTKLTVGDVLGDLVGLEVGEAYGANEIRGREI